MQFTIPAVQYDGDVVAHDWRQDRQTADRTLRPGQRPLDERFQHILVVHFVWDVEIDELCRALRQIACDENIFLELPLASDHVAL